MSGAGIPIAGFSTTSSIFGTTKIEDDKSDVQVKDVSYDVPSAKMEFLKDAVIVNSSKFGVSLLIIGFTLLLGIWTAYWVLAFFIVLPFSLKYFSHLLTISFDYWETQRRHGRE